MNSSHYSVSPVSIHPTSVYHARQSYRKFFFLLSSVTSDPDSSTHAFTQDIAAAEQVSLHELTVQELSPSDPTRNVAVLRRSEAREKERNSVL